MHLTVGYLATPTGDDGVALASAANKQEPRQIQVAAAKENLVVAARTLPDVPDIDSLVADGTTLESALKKLNWDESDVLVVGSSRFATPKRLFLGSTAARILAGTEAPVIVVPRSGTTAC
jgi:nucleotide-binding universal stress UspA family protein